MTLSSIFSLLSKINLTNLSKFFKAIMVVNFKMHMSTLFSPNMVFSCATPIPIAPPKRPCLAYASHHRQHGSHSSLSISSHLINILPTKSLDDLTPHEVLFCVSPTYSHLHIFGCLCYPNVAATAPYMFAPRATHPLIQHRRRLFVASILLQYVSLSLVMLLSMSPSPLFLLRLLLPRQLPPTTTISSISLLLLIFPLSPPPECYLSPFLTLRRYPTHLLSRCHFPVLLPFDLLLRRTPWSPVAS